MGTLETAAVTTGTVAFFAGLIAEQEARVAATKAFMATYVSWFAPATTHAH